MKKVFLLIFAIFLLSACGAEVKEKNTNLSNRSVETNYSENIEKTKEYYDNFRKKCNNSNCCISSVDNAEKVNSIIYEDNVICENNSTLNMNKCINSYKWCEPKK